VNSGSKRQTEDKRILKSDALDTANLIRIALRCSLIDNYRRMENALDIEMDGTVLELSEHVARVFLWGLIRGRERTLAQLRG
jgi:hypothetical protein